MRRKRDAADELTRVFCELIAEITTVRVPSAEKVAIGHAGVRPCAERD